MGLANDRDRLSGYLSEMEMLIGRPVTKEELIPKPKVEELRQRLLVSEMQPLKSWVIPFDEHRAQALRKLMVCLSPDADAEVYVWTPRSNVFGLVPPISLSSFALEFPFDVNPEGIVSLVAAELSDRLVLDFSASGRGEELEIEVMGPNWGGKASQVALP